MWITVNGLGCAAGGGDVGRSRAAAHRIVRLLIAHKADVNLADKNGVSPLQHARRRSHREIERALQAAGAQ
jgi:ankyrin repeat protein